MRPGDHSVKTSLDMLVYDACAGDFHATLLLIVQMIHRGVLAADGRLGLRIVREPAGPRAAVLSHREEQVLGLLAGRWTTQEIATRLRISPHTVSDYRKRLREKLAA